MVAVCADFNLLGNSTAQAVQEGKGLKVSKNAAKESEVYVFALWAGYTGLTKTWKNTAKANLFLVENIHRDVGKALIFKLCRTIRS